MRSMVGECRHEEHGRRDFRQCVCMYVCLRDTSEAPEGRTVQCDLQRSQYTGHTLRGVETREVQIESRAIVERPHFTQPGKKVRKRSSRPEVGPTVKQGGREEERRERLAGAFSASSQHTFISMAATRASSLPLAVSSLGSNSKASL